MANVVINLIVTAKGVKAFGDAGKQLSALGKKADQIGKGFVRVGESLTGVGTAVTSVALPLVALGGFAIKTANDFNRSFLEIENLVGIAADEVGVMREAVLQLAGETAKRPRELADALFAVTSAGKSGQEALDILEGAAKASAIGLGDVRDIALAVTAATTAYGSETLSAATATDVLVNTVKFGNLEASELAGTLGRVTAIAAQVGLSVQDTGAFIATFTRLGGDAAEATTALRGILGAIIKPGSDAAKALAEMGLSAEGLRRTIQEEGIAQALEQVIDGANGNVEALARVIPNVRALTGVLATAGSQGEEFAEIQEKIRNGLGVTEEGFENFSKSAVFSFDQFIAKAETAAIRLGDSLAPALADLLDAAEPVFDFIENLAKKFSELDPATQKTAVAFALAAAAAGPLLIILGQVATGAGKLIQLSSGLVGGLGKMSTSLASTGGAATLSAGAITGLSIAAVAATAAIAVKGTQAIVGYGDSLRGINDPIRDAVAQQGFLAQTMAVLPDIVGLAKTAFFGLVDVLKGIPLIGDIIKVTFSALTVVFQELAKGLSIISDAATSFFEKFIGAEGRAQTAQQQFIVSQQQLARASEITGRAITDQAEASQILKDEIARLRGEHEANTAATQASTTATEAAAGASEADAAAKLANAAATKAAKEANEQYLKSVQDLVGNLGFGALNAQLSLTEDALKSLGGASELSRSGLESLRSVIDQARLDGVQLTGELLNATQALNLLDLQAGLLELDFTVPALSAEEMNLALEDMEGVFGEVGDVSELVIAGIGADLGGLPPKVFDFGDAMDGVNDLLSETRGLMTLFGIESDSVFGKIVAGATKVFDTFNSIIGIADKIIGIFSGAGGGGGGLLGGLFGGGGGGGGLLSSLGGLFGGGGGGGGLLRGLGGLVGLGGGAAAAGGGAAAAAAASTTIGGVTVGGLGAGGSAAGTGFLASFGSTVSGGLSSLGASLAPLFTNPFTIGIGAAIGGFFLIKSLLSGRDAGTVGEEAGRDMGIGISDALSQTIFKAEKPIQLFLSEIFAEGQLSAARLAEEQADVFSGIEQGAFSAQEGMAALAASVPDLIANFNELGSTGESQVERLLRASFDTGVSFEGIGNVVTALGESLLEAAQTGGQAFLTATNEIGTTGRESLEFLRNAFGSELPASVLASIESILGLNSAVAETAGGANQIGAEFAALPSVAAAAVDGIQTSFAEGSTAITEGLQPISELIANEIRDAGAATSEAVKTSFDDTSQAIKAGLGQVAGVFSGPVVDSANAAAAAADRIADAVRRVASEARKISFPGDGGGGLPVGAQGGFRGKLSSDTLIQAHRGEFVNIVPADETRRMNFVSAQGGIGPGPISVSTGKNRMEFNITGGSETMDENFFRNRILPMFEESLRRNENEIVQRIREQIFEEVR